MFDDDALSEFLAAVKDSPDFFPEVLDFLTLLKEKGILKKVIDNQMVSETGATMRTDASVGKNKWVLDENDMKSASASKVPTQRSVKNFVESKMGAEPFSEKQLNKISGNSKEKFGGHVICFNKETGEWESISPLSEDPHVLIVGGAKNEFVSVKNLLAAAALKSDTSTKGFEWVINEESFETNSPTKVPTQQSVKRFIEKSLGLSKNKNRKIGLFAADDYCDSLTSSFNIGPSYARDKPLYIYRATADVSLGSGIEDLQVMNPNGNKLLFSKITVTDKDSQEKVSRGGAGVDLVDFSEFSSLGSNLIVDVEISFQSDNLQGEIGCDIKISDISGVYQSFICLGGYYSFEVF